MNQFTAKYADAIRFVLCGFDRLVFRGTIRGLSFVDGMRAYLRCHKVLLKDFGSHVEDVTARIKQASLAPVEALGRPVRYLASSRISKEEIARRIAKEQGMAFGPVCVLTSVEPCQTFEVYRNRSAKKLEVVSRVRKCLYLYHYMVHPVFGFMNARIQTWFPFNVQICINGREWLARQMDEEGLGYVRVDNCFTSIVDPTRAQELMDAQLQVHWPELLAAIGRTLNPIHDEVFSGFGATYYWSTHQSEWATDMVFADVEKLRRLYPMLIRHGITSLSSPDVMRFLGRKLGPSDRIPSAFLGEVTSDIKTRQEGVRIKHRVGGNSVKLYDKAYAPEGAVLRAETTLNNGQDFKVYRPKEGDPDGLLEWRTLRKGVADLHRQAQVSQASNNRYLDALSSVDDSATLDELIGTVTAPTDWRGKRVRALHPFERHDARLLEAVSRGEFAINGLRNKDLQRMLFGSQGPITAAETRRRSGQATRMLRLLRAHGILSKVPHTHRYVVTDLGRKIVTAILTARNTPISQILPAAA